MVHDLFEEQTSVEKVIYKIMKRAQSLLKCERCTVLLKDQKDEDSEVSGAHRKHYLFREDTKLKKMVENDRVSLS